MRADPEIRARLRVIDTLPLDVEANLGAVHRRSRARATAQRVAAAVLALGIVVVGAVAAWRLVALRDDRQSPAAGGSGRIAYTAVDGEAGTYRMRSVNGDGSGIQPLPVEGRSAYFPVWSPDGAKVAFVELEDSGDPGTLVVMAADGSDRRAIAPADHAPDSLTWSPDGTRIAYTRSDPPNQAGVWVVHADGMGLERVLSGRWRNVAWAPDGSILLLAGFPVEDPAAGDIGEPADLYTIRADGTGLTRLTETEADEDFPSWSPDGSRIVFTRHPYTGDDVVPHSDVFVMNADGSGATRLTDWKGFDAFPVWSPDGQRIAFSSDRGSPVRAFDEGFAVSLYVMAADGSGVRLLVEAQEGLLAASSWTA